MPTLYPRFRDGSWWAYDSEFDSDTGPYSSEEQAQDWIDETNSTVEDRRKEDNDG